MMKPSTSFADVLEKHRERLGAPVTLEEIFALHDATEGSGSLSEKERVELLDRIAADPEAARKLKALLRFPKMSAPATASGVDKRWDDFKKRLEPVKEVREAEDVPRNPPTRALRWPRYVALAASFVLVSALMFWLGSFQVPAPPSHADSRGVRVNPVIVELKSAETVHRGTQQVAWPARAEALVVVLSSSNILDREPKDLVVIDAEGEVISRSAGLLPNEAGLLSVTFSREALPPGVYLLQLEDEAGDVSDSFPIEVYAVP